MENKIIDLISEHNDIIEELLKDRIIIEKIELITKKIVESYRRGGKLVMFGNGGSASDAQHLVAELVNKLNLKRPMLNALALNVNTSIITAIGNDISFDDIFSRQIEYLIDYKDVVIGLSTSGNSLNVVKALQVARNKGAWTIGFTGNSDCLLKDCVDILIDVPSKSTPRIQEAHIMIGHIICELVESELFGK